MKLSQFSFLTVLAASVAVAAPGSSVKTVRDGIAAWQRADYSTAVAIWRPLAEKGDSDAQFNLGQAYRLGRGVTVDLAQAKGWLEKAAKAGHLDAQTTLGLLLFDSGSRDAAIVWLRKAAERGEPRAMLVYGTALFNGDGAPRDPLMAYAYVSRAAAQGLEPAKSTLDQMDQVIPLDTRRRAVEIALQKAAEKPAPGTKPPAKVASKPAAKPAPDTPKPPVKVAAKPATPPARAPAASGSWRVQLGAFTRKSSAEALYRKLSGSAPIAGHPAYYVPASSVTRLQVGGFASKSAAASACSTLSARGHPCFAVPGK
jgi:TPR repeat protein